MILPRAHWLTPSPLPSMHSRVVIETDSDRHREGGSTPSGAYECWVQYNILSPLSHSNHHLLPSTATAISSSAVFSLKSPVPAPCSLTSQVKYSTSR
ncbi:hypothetical protein K2173_005227 [Erythroxylum novogranatense]|uniref:Uncharacterized protein n=1 Tax=Erythroxylum novogranatense TaxID=1862640 RepID=A0AAV8TU67_9ROSI|nr:hypothetical protein K2173_005227 [Erythroxylum novogranatense]